MTEKEHKIIAEFAAGIIDLMRLGDEICEKLGNDAPLCVTNATIGLTLAHKCEQMGKKGSEFLFDSCENLDRHFAAWIMAGDFKKHYSLHGDGIRTIEDFSEPSPVLEAE